MKAVAVLIAIAVSVVYLLAFPYIPTFMLGILGGVFVFLFALPLAPGLIAALSNKPNLYRVDGVDDELSYPDYPKSTFGFFTFLQPGRGKNIERNGRFIRGIMDWNGHMYFGQRGDNTYEPNNSEYWRAVKTEPPYQDTHPIPFPICKMADLDKKPLWIFYSPLSIVWWIWKRWVYTLTGGIFTGIWPFQMVRTYPIERFKRLTGVNGEVSLKKIHDYSDHARLADFQYPVIIPRADTNDKISVSIILNIVARVFNQYELAYNTDDDWTTRLPASISNAVNLFTRPRSLDDVLSAKTEAEAQLFADTVTQKTQLAVECFGVEIDHTEVIDISPTNDAQGLKLGDVAVARVDRLADEERAKGKAAYIREEGDALAKHPNATVVVQTEGLVRAAQAAGQNGGTVILGGGSAVDPIQVAILNALNRNGGKP